MVGRSIVINEKVLHIKKSKSKKVNQVQYKLHNLNFIKSKFRSTSVRESSLFNFLDTRLNFTSDKSEKDSSFQFKLSHSRFA